MCLAVGLYLWPVSAGFRCIKFCSESRQGDEHCSWSRHPSRTASRLWARAQQNHNFAAFIQADLINKFLRDISQDTVPLQRCRRSGLGFQRQSAEGLNMSNTPHRELIPFIDLGPKSCWTQKHWENIKNCLDTNLSAFPEWSFRQHFRSYRFWKWILGALRGFRGNGEGIDF